MKSIDDIQVSGKKVLVRVDFNVPLDEFQNITDDSRIKRVLPTLQYILDNNARLIIASHLGRPKGKFVEKLSLASVAGHLEKLLGRDVKLAGDCIGDDVNKIVSDMKTGDIVLLENLRFHDKEQKNDSAFAKELSLLCDVYVNDAFAVSHRKNASVDAIVGYAPESCAGFLLHGELAYINNAMNNPSRPFVAVIGGAKVSSKLKALENMLHHVNKIIIGGAMANTFLKSTGIDVGKSKVEDDLVEVAGSLMKKACMAGIKFYIPVDVVAADRFDSNAVVKNVKANEIPSSWMALDIGPATSLLYSEALCDAKTIVWNGPMGVFEMDAFSRGTLEMAKSVASSQALSIVGGGDTDAALHSAGETKNISYVSTGGGAFLALLEGKSLPAVTALENA